MSTYNKVALILSAYAAVLGQSPVAGSKPRPRGASECSPGFTWCSRRSECIETTTCCTAGDCTSADAPDPCHTVGAACVDGTCSFRSRPCPAGSVCTIVGASASCSVARLSLNVKPKASSYAYSTDMFDDGKVAFEATITNVSAATVSVALDDQRLFTTAKVKLNGRTRLPAVAEVSDDLVERPTSFVSLAPGQSVSRTLSEVVGHPSAQGSVELHYRPKRGKYTVRFEYQNGLPQPEHPLCQRA